MPAFLEMGAPSLMLKEGLRSENNRPHPFSLSHFLSHTHKHLCFARPLFLLHPKFRFFFSVSFFLWEDREKWVLGKSKSNQDLMCKLKQK